VPSKTKCWCGRSTRRSRSASRMRQPSIEQRLGTGIQARPNAKAGDKKWKAQEGQVAFLANAEKHAGPRHAQVRLGLCCDVTN
jgi:hypothetical protein